MEIFRKIITVHDEREAKRALLGSVSVVDDDAAVLQSLRLLIEYEGFNCSTYSSVAEFIEGSMRLRFPGPRCILSDMYLPDLNGLNLQEALEESSDQPIVFMSGMGLLEHVVQAFRRGAVHFLSKPINDSELFLAIQEAISISARIQQARTLKKSLNERAVRLTPRERELAQLLPDGLSINEMADAMDVSDRAIKLYKKNLMEKLEIKSVYELVTFKSNGLI